MKHRILAAIGLALSFAAPLAAQEPFRPDLPRNADVNDWQAYYDYGVQAMRLVPERSADAFYWAARLDPSRAEPLFGQWAAFYARSPQTFEEKMQGIPEVWRRPDVIAADSLAIRAEFRNPFVHRGLEVLVWDKVPGFWNATRENIAWTAYNENNLIVALRNFNRLIAGAGPRDMRRLRYWRALTYVSAGQFDSALVDMNFLLAGARSDEQRYLMRGADSKELLEYSIGMLELARGNVDAAKEAMLRAMVENAGFYAAHAELGRIALAQNNAEEAVSEYSQAVELNGTDGYVRYQYAQALSAAGRHDDAVLEYRRAQQLEPYYADIDLHLAVALERAGKTPEALVAYRRFVQRAPRRNAEQITRVQARIRTVEAAGGGQ